MRVTKAFTLTITVGLLLGLFCSCKGSPVPPETRAQTNNSTAAAGVTASAVAAAGIPPTVKESPAELKGTWAPYPLRYDYLNSEENPYAQVAVWHPYIDHRLDISVPLGAPDATLTKSPQIIMPRKEGKVFVYTDYSGNSKLMPLGSTSYKTKPDDVAMLKSPGWGLATQFTPPATPYRINRISLCGVAYHDESLAGYANYHVLVKILDKDGNELWSDLYDWETFRNKSTAEPDDGPRAMWKDIHVPSIEVSGDFYIDVIADSMTYPNLWQRECSAGYHYFALAYEQAASCDSSHSFISENGKRSDPNIGLYNSVGDSRCFNLCIRVDGSYLEKK